MKKSFWAVILLFLLFPVGVSATAMPMGESVGFQSTATMFDPTGIGPSAGKLVGTGSPTLEPKPVSNLLSAFYPGAVSGTEGSVPDVTFRHGVSLPNPNVRGTDPGTMLLVGSCLICLAEIGRKMRKSRK